MPFSPIKSQIRDRFGSIKAFEEAQGLRPGMVRDHLRGRSVAAAENALLREFGPHKLEAPRLKRRRRGSALEVVDRDTAIARCEAAAADLTAALDRAVEAIADLRRVIESERAGAKAA